MTFKVPMIKAGVGIAAALVAVALFIIFTRTPSPLTLVKNGRAEAVIVTGKKPAAQALQAAHELADYIHRVTGAQLPIENFAPASQTRVLVGVSACTKAIRARLRLISGDGYLIESDGNSLELAGNGDDGTFFAVYKFLERFVGVHWLWPGKSGEVIPSNRTLAIGQVSMERAPAYLWRNLGPGGPLWDGMDKWTAQRKLGISVGHHQLEKLWELHNGFGGVRFSGGHAWGKIIPPAKYGPTHPEYFALVNGKRRWQHFDGKHGAQLETTNPEVIRLVADYADQFFAQHPDYDGVSISPNDGGGFCNDPTCLSLDSGRYEIGPKGQRIRVITGQMITYANQVGDLVAREFPSKKLLLFAYGPYRLAPLHVKPRNNIIIQYTFHASQDWNTKAEARQFQDTLGWSRSAKNLGIYEYFIQGNFPDLPRLMVKPVQRSVEVLHDQGYRYYQTQAGDGYAINGLNYYILARLLWNPSLDAKAVIKDYAEHGFGKVAPEVEQYFDTLESQWEAQNGKPVAMDSATLQQYERVAAAYPPSFLTACRRDLQKAYLQSRGEDRKRVQFLEEGLHYVDLTLDAVRKTIPLFKAGWKFVPSVSAPPNANVKEFERALFAWKERDQYVESLKQDFVVSYFWIRYNERFRTFVPLQRMEEYAKAHNLPVPSFRITTPLTAKESQKLRSEIRTTFHVPDPLPKLAPKTYSRFVPTKGVMAERVTYGTQFGMRIPAILYLPKTHKGKIPGLIVVNGHGGDKYSWYAFYSGILYARAGAAVLTYDPVGEGERNIDRKSETRAHDQIQEPEAEMARHLAGLMMTDLMQGVSYLSQRPEVDPHRIAAMGYSLGSYVVSVTCAVDPRLHACVADGGGDLDGRMEYWDNTKPMCTGIPYRSLMFLGDRGAVIYALRSLIGPSLVFNGTADQVVAILTHEEPWFQDLQKRVAQLRGTTKGIFKTGWNPGTGHRPYFVTRPVALWLNRQLNFPNWTEASIKAMPTTHISNWAKANGVEIDPLYASQLREGGVDALGTGVPGLSRKELSVFAPQQWQRRKRQLTYEAWVKFVKAQIARVNNPTLRQARQ